MSWQFWMIPLVFFFVFGFRRGPRGFGPWNRDRESLAPVRDAELAAEVESQRDYISALEARVAELENRLDFTERLLSTRAGSSEGVR